MTADSLRVRLFVVTDYGHGFMSMIQEPLPLVTPGETYVTAFTPQRAIVFDEVVVDGFELTHVTIAARSIEPTVVMTDGSHRLYRLDTLRCVTPDKSVQLHLRNSSDAPRAQKIVTILATRPADPTH